MVAHIKWMTPPLIRCGVRF